MAHIINTQSGGAVIAPWQIDQLPEDWLDTFEGLTHDLPELRNGEQMAAALVAKMKAEHPTYRKR